MYIDIMKGLLIILVVIGHLPFFDYNSRTLTLIYSFHMHSFLILGGVLSHINENTEFYDIIAKRVKKTLIPYFLFYLISFLITPISSRSNLSNNIITVFLGIGHPDYAINLPLWFLTFYFIGMTTFEVIEYISYKIRKVFFKKCSYYIVAIFDLIIILPLMNLAYTYARIYKRPRLPFNIEIAIFCLLFIYLGKISSTYIKKVYKDIVSQPKLKIVLTVFLSISILAFIYCWYNISMFNGRIDLNARDYKNSLLMYIAAILGFTIFAFFSFIISKIPCINNFVAILGVNSIYILAYHVPSTAYTYGQIISRLPAIVGTALSNNSIYSITLLTSFAIWFSLIMAYIHSLCQSIAKKIYNVRNNNNN